MSPLSRPPIANKWEQLLTKLAVFVSILLVVGGAVGMILVQQSLRESQDLRQQASVAAGQVEVTTAAAALALNGPSQIDFLINTHGIQTDGVQLTFNVVTDTFDEPPVLALKPGIPLQIAYSEVETTADGFLISLIALPTSIGQPFSTNLSTAFAQLSFLPTRAGTITFNFDVENSIATLHASNPPQDELTHIATMDFQIAGPTSPTPTPTPTPTPSVTPTPSADVSPSPTTAATPTPTPTPSVGGTAVQTCNESCAVNADCDVNLRCYSGQCRLVTNVTSSTCSAPADQGLSFGCNEYCADSRECATGLTCQNNKCRNPENLSSASCAELSTTQKASLVKSCNESCDASTDCDVNLRCYNGACRLATNPSSFSCSPATAKTVSTGVYGGTKGADDGTSGSATISGSPNGSAVPATVRPTARPTTDGTQTSAETEKTALDTVKNYFMTNPQVPLMAVGLGLGLIVALFLLSFLRRNSGPRPPQSPSGGLGTTPADRGSYEQDLQTKINSLKKDQASATPHPSVVPTGSAAPSAPVAPPAPVTPQAPTTPASTASDLNQMKVPENRPVSYRSPSDNSQNSNVIFPPTPAAPTPVPPAAAAPPTPAAAPTPAASPASSMLERLKSKNVQLPSA